MGKKGCTAGVGNSGVLTAVLSFVKVTEASDETQPHEGSESESLTIRVGGTTNIDRGTSEHRDWLLQDLSVGDEITINIVEARECDEPKTKDKSSPMGFASKV